MPRAASLILEAADRYPRTGKAEDRLTEVLACALAGVPEFNTWFLGRVYADGSAAPAEWATECSVHTQAWISDAARPDMEIRFPPGRGPGGRLFCEHKLDADPTPQQALGYPDLRPEDRLIAITPRGYRLPTRFQERILWQEIVDGAAKVARRLVGRAGSRRAWRAVALRPHASARLRILAELTTYVQRTVPEVTLDDALSHLDVVAYGRAKDVLHRMRMLFEAAAGSEHLSGFSPGNPERRDIERRGETSVRDSWYVHLAHEWPTVDSQAGWFEFLVAPDDEWVTDALHEPAFGVGYSVYLTRGNDWPAAFKSPVVEEELRRSGIALGETHEASGPFGRVFKTLYLAEVMKRGPDLTSQADYVARWVRRSLEGMTTFDLAGR